MINSETNHKISSYFTNYCNTPGRLRVKFKIQKIVNEAENISLDDITKSSKKYLVLKILK